ncbi:hypothetical protein PITCH_A140045 [uncultured Desulfobacterium sp.]|uniref:Uncharacterized protein n=1 Tax=uncultured Desulfobacterium sp. TaxID=201089 RepID=A0A445MSZ4_9BACT|nr:hypothetical protein PITCH_A140045 [uncultured Desulfobacterium sp.]
MRKSKTIKVDDKEIVVKELRVKDIRKIAEEAEKDDVEKRIPELLPLATDLALHEMEDMAPSELKVVWEAFKEVNADFLSVMEGLGIGKALKNSLQRHLTGALADLSSVGMPTSGNMDLASS